MKTSFFYSGILGMLVFISACNSNSSSQQETGKDNNVAKGENDARVEEHGGPVSVQLNNGAKWEANPETTTGISNMKNLVAGLPSSPTQEDFTMLQEKLKAEFKMIFQKCTMTGESHNQLHNYLLPLKDMIENLDDGTVEKSGKALEEIRERLAAYDQYFV